MKSLLLLVNALANHREICPICGPGGAGRPCQQAQRERGTARHCLFIDASRAQRTRGGRGTVDGMNPLAVDDRGYTMLSSIYGCFPKFEYPNSWMVYGKSENDMDDVGILHFRKPAYSGIVTMNWESVAEFQWTIEGVKTGDSRCGPDQYAHGCRRYIHSKIPYNSEVDPPKKGFHQQKNYVQSPWGVYTYQLLSLAPHLILKRSSGNAFLQSKHKSLVVDVEKWGL